MYYVQYPRDAIYEWHKLWGIKFITVKFITPQVLCPLPLRYCINYPSNMRFITPSGITLTTPGITLITLGITLIAPQIFLISQVLQSLPLGYSVTFINPQVLHSKPHWKNPLPSGKPYYPIDNWFLTLKLMVHFLSGSVFITLRRGPLYAFAIDFSLEWQLLAINRGQIMC